MVYPKDKSLEIYTQIRKMGVYPLPLLVFLHPDTGLNMIIRRKICKWVYLKTIILPIYTRSGNLVYGPAEFAVIYTDPHFA